MMNSPKTMLSGERGALLFNRTLTAVFFLVRILQIGSALLMGKGVQHIGTSSSLQENIVEFFYRDGLTIIITLAVVAAHGLNQCFIRLGFNTLRNSFDP